MIVGAIGGYVAQVANNMSTGMSFGDALVTDISGTKILQGAAIAGIGVTAAITGGVALGIGAGTITTIGQKACADGDCTNEVTVVQKSLQSIPAEQVTQKVQTGVNTVYQYIENGVVKYVGITNDFSRRAAEHLKHGWEIQPINGLDQLGRFDARAVEQVLIEQYQLGNLYNKINSIALSNPIYNKAILRGTNILRHLNIMPK